MLPFGIHFLPVPELFFSAYLGEPFRDCISCGSDLNSAAIYVVQKRFVIGEAIFEMAICDKCRQQLTDAYSEETRKALSDRMADCFRRRPSASDAVEGTNPDGEDLLRECIDYCLMCSVAREQCRRYSLAGLFRSRQIVVQKNEIGQSPVMICDQCEEGLSGLISQKTRDAWDRFVEDHFDGPPGIDLDVPYENPVAF